MKLPRDWDGTKLASRLTSLGFTKTHQVGSHIQLVHSASGDRITIPAHAPIKVGTLARILRDVADITGLTRDEIIRHLN